jgi:hypothetical protein
MIIHSSLYFSENKSLVQLVDKEQMLNFNIFLGMKLISEIRQL